MIRTPYTEINRACSLRHRAHRTCDGATSIFDDSEKTDVWCGETVSSLIFGHPGPRLGEVH